MRSLPREDRCRLGMARERERRFSSVRSRRTLDALGNDVAPVERRQSRTGHEVPLAQPERRCASAAGRGAAAFALCDAAPPIRPSLLDLTSLALVSAGAFLGAVAAGAGGFAFAIVASAIWLHAVDPVRSAFLVVSLGTVLHAGLVWTLRAAIAWRRLAPFLAGAAFGVPIGVTLLTVTDPAPLRRTLGALLLAFGLYALLVRGLPRIARGGRGADAAVGLAGGVLGGLGGFAGVPTTIWTQLRGWPKEAARGVFQPFILASHVATLILLGGLTVDGPTVLLAAAALPALALGAWLGLRLYGRLDEVRFRRLLAALVALSGVSLLV